MDESFFAEASGGGIKTPVNPIAKSNQMNPGISKINQGFFRRCQGLLVRDDTDD